MAMRRAPDANNRQEKSLQSIFPRATAPGTQVRRTAAQQNNPGRQHSRTRTPSVRNFQIGKSHAECWCRVLAWVESNQGTSDKYFDIVSSQSQMSAAKRPRVQGSSAAVDALPSASNAAKRKRATGLVDQSLELAGNDSGANLPRTAF
jgi:hypothetical protein